MQDLTPEQIAAAEKAMIEHRYVMPRIADFINQPRPDKHGKEKSMSMHMKVDYVACALDELHERTKNSIALHAAQIADAWTRLYAKVERLEKRIAELEEAKNGQ